VSLSLPFVVADPPVPPPGTGAPAAADDIRRPGPRPAAADAGADPAPAPPGPSAAPELCHPALWRASQLGRGSPRCSASGHVQLDAQLPGGGWPHGVLTELLLPRPGIGELRLLAPVLAPPALACRVSGEPRCVMLFDPPALLSAWALLQQGLDPVHWLIVGGGQGWGTRLLSGRPGQGPGGDLAPWSDAGAGAGAAMARPTSRPAVRGLPQPSRLPHPPHRPHRPHRPHLPHLPGGRPPLLPQTDVLWALEQALRSGHLGAALAWLPAHGLRAEALRRLQLAAQSHDGPVFLFRDEAARLQPSVAPLRLWLRPQGIDGLSVRVLKRHGPALAQPLRLVLPPVLEAARLARAQARHALAQAAAGGGRPLAGQRPAASGRGEPPAAALRVTRGP
jgi:protein ImuA